MGATITITVVICVNTKSADVYTHHYCSQFIIATRFGGTNCCGSFSAQSELFGRHTATHVAQLEHHDAAQLYLAIYLAIHQLKLGPSVPTGRLR